MSILPFKNREDAARRLAGALEKYQGDQPLVLAIPRGAVPMGRTVADLLGGDLDVVLVRRLAAPNNPEFAIGAVDERREVFLNDYANWAGVTDEYLRGEVAAKSQAMSSQRRHLCAGRPPRPVQGRTVIVLDDGLATGATMVAALRAVRQQKPKKLVCAVPVGAAESVHAVSEFADETICLEMPSPFYAVSLYYLDFRQVSDEEAQHALRRPDPREAADCRTVRIIGGGAILLGDLCVPAAAKGITVFVDGSRSNGMAPLDRYFAASLQRRGIATLVIGLLTPHEAAGVLLRFELATVTTRLADTLTWIREQPALEELPVGLFATWTGAPAASAIAGDRVHRVGAVVAHAPRMDLVDLVVDGVETPTLFLVESAHSQGAVPGGTAHPKNGTWTAVQMLPGMGKVSRSVESLEEIAGHTCDWFERYFAAEQFLTAQLG